MLTVSAISRPPAQPTAAGSRQPTKRDNAANLPQSSANHGITQNFSAEPLGRRKHTGHLINSEGSSGSRFTDTTTGLKAY